MAIKVVKPPCKLYYMQCPLCYAEFEYELEDIEGNTVQCPCCNTHNPVLVYGKPVYVKLEDTEKGVVEKHEESPSEKIINSWRETRLKEISEENERLRKQIENTKKTAKIKEPKRLSNKQCSRLVKKYNPKRRK